MFKKNLALIAIVCTLWACNLQAQCTKTWVGGPVDWWESPENWNPYGEPNEFDRVCISDARVGLNDSHGIYTLDCYGTVKLQKWTPYRIQLTITDGLTNHGELDLNFDIQGNVTNTAGANLQLGDRLDINGSLYNQGTIIAYPDEIDVWGTEILNTGIIFAFRGSLGEVQTFHNSGKIGLYDGGCHGIDFNNDSNGVIEGFGYITADQTIINKGVIKASKGALRLFCNGSLNNAGTLKNDVGSTLHIAGLIPIEDISNQGAIEANADGSIVFDCNLINEPNATMKLNGGTLAASTITQSADANFTGFGGITGNVVIESDGLIKLTGPTNIVGDVEISENATLEISDGTTLITGHTTCNGTIHMKGGQIIPQGGISGACNIIWEPGLYYNIADFNLDGRVNLEDFAYFADVWLWQASHL